MVKITYYGHSSFKISDGKNNVIIDPFLSGNPVSPVKPEDIKVSHIILTHAHGDHLGDAIKLAEKNDATIIAVFELANYFASKGIKTHDMHIGGSHTFPFGKVKFTIAHHGSSTSDGKYMGAPAGVIVSMEGKNIYHCGDTGLFYDMKLIGEMTPIDIMLVPIGDNYTMGIDDAVKAVELANPRIAIPMHYNTFDVIKADPSIFGKKLSAIGKNFIIMNFGETIEI
jgi:L-ascorbate metabolism protein UlaG (beta-lactamase superfamily)